MEIRKTMIAVYALTHLLVDFACAFLVFRGPSDADTQYICFLLYNFCAFALQMPLGLLADRLNKNALCAAAGCVLVAAAYGFSGLPLAGLPLAGLPLAGLPLAAAVIAGLGNGLFHIGGGIDVLNVSGGKAGPLGVFVSPGALGIFLGKLLGRQSGAIGAIVVVAVLLGAAAAILRLRFNKGRFFVSGNAPVSFDRAGSPAFLTAALCFFLVVCLRSYAGMTLAFPWKGERGWGYVLVFAVVLGKTTGGFLADRFGALRTSVVTLGIATALFLLPNIPLTGILAVFLFNMTMPITLWAITRLLPGAKGFTFGLLTFGLYLGFIPVYLGNAQLPGAWLGMTAAAAVSLLLLLAGLKLTARLRGDG